MDPKVLKRTARLVVAGAALMAAFHIETHDDRRNWLALIPSVMLASAAVHFGHTALAAHNR